MVVGWADIPELSTCVGCCSAAWLQSWLQSRRNGADPRPSVFQAGHIPRWDESCECAALSSVAVACRWSLLLLSPLLSAAERRNACRVVIELARVIGLHLAVERRGIIDGVPELILVSGPPGAGKTTAARALSQLFDPSALVPGDQFFTSSSGATSRPGPPSAPPERDRHRSRRGGGRAIGCRWVHGHLRRRDRPLVPGGVRRRYQDSLPALRDPPPTGASLPGACPLPH